MRPSKFFLLLCAAIDFDFFIPVVFVSAHCISYLVPCILIEVKLNKEWHQKNRMPKNPTQDQRIEWHLEHEKNCSCRPISNKLMDEIRRYRLESQRRKL